MLRSDKEASERRAGGVRQSLFLLGVDHTTTPLSLREECAFSAAGAAEVAAALVDSGKFEESVVLSTCNRTEVYVVPSEERGSAQYMRKFLSGRKRTKVSS